MRLIEQEIGIPIIPGHERLLDHITQSCKDYHLPNEIPVRFAISRTDSSGYQCELGTLVGIESFAIPKPQSIFDFVPRRIENSDRFNAVLVIPTGIGAEIGGHAGDAAPVARLLASVCDTLITHPNVVNASDINELPDNGLYVEGSVITRLLMGTAGLQKVRSNRVLLVIDDHPDARIAELAINSASAARTTLGLSCPLVVRLNPPVHLKSEYSSSGAAVGQVDNLESLLDVLGQHRSEFDAVAIASVIDFPEEYHKEYYDARGDMVNPWGGVEAMLTHTISMLFEVPSAHSPMMESMEVLNTPSGIVDPRMAAEEVSNCFLHCVLKGLHRAPRIVTDKALMNSHSVITAADVSCLVIPDGCVGLPTLAALEQGIPVIAVRENRNRMRNDLKALPFAPGKLFVVENYLEAVGVIASLKAGVALDSVRRPLSDTKVVSVQSEPKPFEPETFGSTQRETGVSLSCDVEATHASPNPT